LPSNDARATTPAANKAAPHARTAAARPRARAAATGVPSASRLIDARIAELGDWRGRMLGRIRKLISQADPAITEEWKWRGTPVFERNGIICTGETYKSVVKVTFFKGAQLPDPAGLFNSSLGGNARRAIDIHEGEEIGERAFKELVRAAVALNTGSGSPAAKRVSRATSAPRTAATRTKPANAGATGNAGTKPEQATRKTKPAAAGRTTKPTLLAGGNPQIAKGEGDAPVQAYIAAMPGWKRDVGQRLDALIERSEPKVKKAVKWNSPFYGVEGKGWFLNVHVFANYVKVTFFRGAALKPAPPGAGKDAAARWVDVREGELDEAQMVKWVKQAARLPGWLT